ncbi:unnamed protein product [Closterium sp. NIES-54]
MRSCRMYHGGAINLHDQANATLGNPILLWGGQKHERLGDAIRTTKVIKEMGGKLTASVKVQSQDLEKVALLVLSKDVGWALLVHVESLQRSSGRRKRGGVGSGALAPLDAGKAAAAEQGGGRAAEQGGARAAGQRGTHAPGQGDARAIGQGGAWATGQGGARAAR